MMSAAESKSHADGVNPSGTGQADSGQEPGVDPRLLEVLVCPVSRSALTYDRDANELISRAAGLAYPIRNGVPVMLRDEARDLGAPK
jgi:uncharacterized protein YbaR (Trm112 family)